MRIRDSTVPIAVFMSLINKKFSRYSNPLLLALLLLYFMLNADVFTDLFKKWYAQDLTGAYSHGLLVAIIVLYLVYKKTGSIRSSLIPNPSLAGLFVLLGSQCMMFLAKIDGINFAQHIFLVTSAFAIVWSAYSYRIARHFVVPAILFSMSFPVWADGKLPLQEVAVVLTNAVLSVTGLPYYHNGPLFYFPNGIIEVAPECAGLQQLLVSIIIGLLFSIQHGLRVLDTVKTLFYISVAAILINTARIIIIMIIGYYTKMESSLITQHVLLGWIIYGIGIFLFLFFYSRVRFKSSPAIASDGQNQSQPRYFTRRTPGVYAVLFVLVILPSLLIFIVTTVINRHVVQPMTYTLATGIWRNHSEESKINWEPKYPAGNELTTATFRNENSTIHMYVSRYSRIKEDIEPINMLNRPYNPKVWSLIRRENLHVRNSKGGIENLRLFYLTSKNKEHLTVLNYYIVNGRAVDKIIDAKLAALFGMLKLKYDIKVVCLAITPNPGNGTGKAELLQFYKDLEIH